MRLRLGFHDVPFDGWCHSQLELAQEELVQEESAHEELAQLMPAHECDAQDWLAHDELAHECDAQEWLSKPLPVHVLPSKAPPVQEVPSATACAQADATAGPSRGKGLGDRLDRSWIVASLQPD